MTDQSRPLYPPRDERVAIIAEMMSAGNWERGKSGKRLAAEWGLSYDEVKRASAEAWRRVQARVLDKSGIQVEAVLKLKEIAQAALDAAKGGGRDAPAERSNAIRAMSELLKFASLVDGGGLASNWSELTLEEKWRRVDDVEARLAAIKATLAPRPDGILAMMTEGAAGAEGDGSGQRSE